LEIKKEADEDADDLFVEHFEQTDFCGKQDFIKVEIIKLEWTCL